MLMLRNMAKIEAAIRDEFAVQAPWLDIGKLAVREIEMYGDIVLWVDVIHGTRDRQVDLHTMSAVNAAIRERLEEVNAPSDAVFYYKPSRLKEASDVSAASAS
jgi:hypothetical protein